MGGKPSVSGRMEQLQEPQCKVGREEGREEDIKEAGRAAPSELCREPGFCPKGTREAEVGGRLRYRDEQKSGQGGKALYLSFGPDSMGWSLTK